MSRIATLLLLLVTASVAHAQEFEKSLRHFNKIIVSPKINLVLIPGDKESIRITYSGVDRGDIIVDQTGRRVHVYLQDARIVDKGERRDNMFERRPKYRHAVVTAYVTFTHLRLIEARGEEEVFCDGNIVTDRLRIRAYGVTELRLAHLEAEDVKARLYGENSLKVREGEVGHMNFRLYGVNKVDTRGLRAATTNTNIYGEGRVSLYVTDEVRVNSIGEPSVLVSGSPVISRGIIIGNTYIRRN